MSDPKTKTEAKAIFDAHYFPAYAVAIGDKPTHKINKAHSRIEFTRTPFWVKKTNKNFNLKFPLIFPVLVCLKLYRAPPP